MKTNLTIITAHLLLVAREIIGYAVQISTWKGYKIFLAGLEPKSPL